MPARRLWALIKGLPAESATARAAGQAWTLRDEMQAAHLEAADRWGRQIHAALLRLGGVKRLPQYGPPVTVSHPDRPAPKPAKRVSMAEAMAAMTRGG